MLAFAPQAWVGPLLRLLPGPLLRALDGWSHRVALKRQKQRQEAWLQRRSA
jgi:hypothetical protein